MVWSGLTSAGVKSISAGEALALQGKGWTLVDVRLAKDFEKGHCEGELPTPVSSQWWLCGVALV